MPCMVEHLIPLVNRTFVVRPRGGGSVSVHCRRSVIHGPRRRTRRGREEMKVKELRGEVALITGAARGMGRLHAVNFAREGSKVVITGDITQIDLPADKTSGLKVAMKVLKNIDDIAICQLTGADVVRHQLVQKIVEAYETYEKKSPAKKTAAPKKTGRKSSEA